MSFVKISMRDRTAIRIRPCRYLNNIVEQDHRAVKRMTRPIWGSSPLWRRAVRLPALRSYTQIAKGNWQSSDRSRTRQPNNSTHSLPMGQQPVRVLYVVPTICDRTHCFRGRRQSIPSFQNHPTVVNFCDKQGRNGTERMGRHRSNRGL